MIELELECCDGSCNNTNNHHAAVEEWVEALDSTVAAMPDASDSAVYQYFQLRSACLSLPAHTAAEAA